MDSPYNVPRCEDENLEFDRTHFDELVCNENGIWEVFQKNEIRGNQLVNLGNAKNHPICTEPDGSSYVSFQPNSLDLICRTTNIML